MEMETKALPPQIYFIDNQGVAQPMFPFDLTRTDFETPTIVPLPQLTKKD